MKRPLQELPARAAPAPSLRESRLKDLDFEDLLGGRLLAWVGGLAVLLGVVFFVAMAVARGWIDEPTRVVLAFLGSSALVGAGLYLFVRQGRTQASLAAVAAGLGGLYASDVAATRLYDLVAPAVGLLCAGVIGAVGTAIAIRWETRLVGALGLLGAIASPVLVDADTSGLTLAFMAVALVAAVAVLLWQQWDWLALGAYVLSVPQLVLWLEDSYEEHLARALVVLLLFWALYVVAAVGYELRVPVERLRAASAMLLLADAVLVSLVGWLMLDDRGHDQGATAWVVGVALVHVVLGGVGFRQRMSREIALLLVAVAIGLSAIALALALDGPALVVGWSVEGALLAWIAGRSGETRAVAAALGFLALAAAHILSIEAEPDSLYRGVDDLAETAAALVVFAGAAFFSARYVPDREALLGLSLRELLDVAGAAAVVYLTSVAIVDVTRGDGDDPGQTPQVLLSAYWSILGFASLLYGLLRDRRAFRLAGFALLAIAIVKVFVVDLAALGSIYRVLSFIALGLLLLAAAFAYQRIRRMVEDST